MQGDIKPRREWMRQHIEALFLPVAIDAPGLLFEIRAIHPATHNTLSTHFAITEKGIDDALDWAGQLNGQDGFNVYIGINPRRHNAPRGRAASADYVHPLHFWHAADFDSPEALDRLRENLDFLPETFQVVTGSQPHTRGHAYWRLEEATRNSAAWTDVQKHLQRAFGTDAIHDLPRILRLAGSVSYPTEKKAAKGYTAELVSIGFPAGRRSVTAEDLLSIPAPDAPPAAQAPSSTAAPAQAYDGSLGLLAAGVDAPACVDAIRRGEDLHNNTRDLIAHLVGTGRNDWEIQTITEELLRGRSDGRTLSEVPGLIEGARQKFNRPDPVTSALVAPAIEASGPKGASAYLGEPPPRQWIVDHWIVQGAVNSLYGDGGIGKTLLAQQIGLCVATGYPFLKLPTKQMPVLAVLCEDDDNEVWRRQHAMIDALEIGYHPKLDDLQLWSRVGAENFLLAYNAQRPLLTPFYTGVIEHLQRMGEGPKLLILDTLADLFSGNEIDRVQANYFIKTTLGSIGQATNSTILLLAHPSLQGLQSGNMLSGSTAWHNAVRSRMALQGIKGDDGKPDPDMVNYRLLTRPKANYAQANAEIMIEYKGGAFVPVEGMKTPTEVQGMRQTVKYEITRMAARGTPLSYYGKAEHSIRRHRFMHYQKRIVPSDVQAAVDYLIDRKEIEVYSGRGKPRGLYPAQSNT